jgi:hypothetical protein
MGRWFALGATLLIMSCTGSAATPSASPSAKKTACRLPVMLWTYPNREAQGGFIDRSSGTFTSDPQSVMAFDSTKRLYRTPNQPYLYGVWGDSVLASSTYDPSEDRWLPVPPQYVSPDGSTYAYAVQGEGVHLVDVASGMDRVVAETLGPSERAHYLVAGYLRDGVYLTQWGPTGGSGLGLWRLDPVGKAIVQVSTDSPGLGVFVGEASLENPPTPHYPDAWWTNDGDDPYVYFQYLSGAAGQHGEGWFQRPGFRMKVIGADTAGRAVVVAESPTQVEVWQLATPKSATQLFAMPNDGRTDLPFKTAVADGTGWWIGSDNGVYLAAAGTFNKVFTTPAVVVGHCGP